LGIRKEYRINFFPFFFLEEDEEYRDFERQMKKMKKIKKADSVY